MQREREKKKLYIMIGQNMKWQNLFSVNRCLIYYRLLSLIYSPSVLLCELLRPFSNEAVLSGPPPLGKISF